MSNHHTSPHSNHNNHNNNRQDTAPESRSLLTALTKEARQVLADLANVRLRWVQRSCKGGEVHTAYAVTDDATPWHPLYNNKDALQIAVAVGLFEDQRFLERFLQEGFKQVVCQEALRFAEARRRPTKCFTPPGYTADVYRLSNGYGISAVRAHNQQLSEVAVVKFYGAGNSDYTHVFEDVGLGFTTPVQATLLQLESCLRRLEAYRPPITVPTPVGEELKVWAQFKVGADGKEYGVRYLLSDLEMRQLKSMGVIGGGVEQIVGMQRDADEAVAQLELALNKSPVQ